MTYSQTLANNILDTLKKTLTDKQGGSTLC